MRYEIRNLALAALVMMGSPGPLLRDAWTQTADRGEKHREWLSTIAFVSTRHDPTGDPWNASEIYLMDGDGTRVRRLTANTWGDGFPSLSPDGRRIIFDSNRLRSEGEPANTSDLFLMNADGTGQAHLVRGSSATWSPDGKRIAFHASASGAGRPIKRDPGAATSDSDIFVVSVDDLRANNARPKNLTNTPAAIDDDPDWSPDGRKIVFTSHAVTDDPINSATAEVYVIDADGSGTPMRLTNNSEEERAPAWSPDGKRILFQCRKGSPPQGRAPATFELCIMNADGTGLTRLTSNEVPELTPSWSPDGRQIAFHRPVGGGAQFQLFLINADGTGERQLTFPPGNSAFANWGEVPSPGPVAQAARVELDHVFIVVKPGALGEIAALRSAGVNVGSDTRRHEGQGTASVAAFFENAYLELIWVDSTVAVAPEHKATARWFRDAAAWRTSGHSPFGLGLRRRPGDIDPLPVPVQREAAPWLGPDAAYEVLHQPSDSRAADFFVVPKRASVPTWIAGVREREPELLRHPGGGREITLVRLLGLPKHQPAAFRILRPNRIEMARAAHPLLELYLDNGTKGERVDLRPVLPLVIVR
jgi:TolB protein